VAAERRVELVGLEIMAEDFVVAQQGAHHLQSSSSTLSTRRRP